MPSYTSEGDVSGMDPFLHKTEEPERPFHVRQQGHDNRIADAAIRFKIRTISKLVKKKFPSRSIVVMHEQFLPAAMAEVLKFVLYVILLF